LRASVGSTEASNGRLARVGVVGPKRAKHRPKGRLREGELEVAVTVAREDTNILCPVGLQ
jgi:hypothetical protein